MKNLKSPSILNIYTKFKLNEYRKIYSIIRYSKQEVDVWNIIKWMKNELVPFEAIRSEWFILITCLA